MHKLVAGAEVDIMMNGEWVGPFTVQAGHGRTEDHAVLVGKSGAFEHYVDAPYNTREHGGSRYATDFPILADSFPDNVVTEGHARYCAEHGHATRTVDGVDTGECPRCGAVTTVTMPNNAPHNALRRHVSGAVERGEAEPIVGIDDDTSDDANGSGR